MYHTCLLCPAQIKESEIYCWTCGEEVSATYWNKRHGAKYLEDWEKMEKRIKEAQEKRTKK
jgi:predicted amidophosphoribosyltransferase